jgi:hypothetical protein
MYIYKLNNYYVDLTFAFLQFRRSKLLKNLSFDKKHNEDRNGCCRCLSWVGFCKHLPFIAQVVYSKIR